MDVFDLFASIAIDTSEYESGMNDASNKTSNFGDKLKTGLTNAAKVGAAAVAAVTTATAALTAAMVKGVSDTAAYGDNIDKMSQKLGMSAEAYQEWDAILQHSGASVDSLSATMKTLSAKYDDAISVINTTTAAADELEAQFESGAITIEEYNQKYDELYNGAYDNIDAFRKLGISMSDLENTGGDTEKVFSLVVSKLQEMPEGAERTAAAADLLGKGAVELGALLNTSAEDTEAMRQRVHELGGVMSDESVKAAAEYQDSLQDMKTAMSGLSRGMISDFMPSITTIMDGLTEIFSGNSDKGIGLVSQGLDNFISNISESIPRILEVGGQIVNSLLGAITSNLPKLISAGTEVLIEFVSGIVEALPEMATAALEAITALASGISNSLPELIPTIVDVVLQIVETLIDNVDALVDAAIEITIALAEGLVDALPILIEKAPIIISKLIAAIANNAPKLIEAAVTIIVTIAKGIISNIPKLLEAIPQIITSIVDGFSTYYSKILDIGKNIVSGIWSGISEKANWLKEKVSGFFSGVVDGVKNLLGIHSPSTVFADMGKNMALGLGDGWDNEFSGVQKQIQESMDFGTANVDFFSSGLGAVTPGFVGNSSISEIGDIVLPITLEIDGEVMARKMYRYNRDESERIGTSFVRV